VGAWEEGFNEMHLLDGVIFTTEEGVSDHRAHWFQAALGRKGLTFAD
jgi:hypothetical protein